MTRPRLLWLGLGALLAAAGCGGAAPPAANDAAAPPSVAAGPSTTPAAPSPSGTGLPSVVVHDLRAGTKVDLRTVPPPDKPLLVWFWAPH